MNRELLYYDISAGTGTELESTTIPGRVDAIHPNFAYRDLTAELTGPLFIHDESAVYSFRVQVQETGNYSVVLTLNTHFAAEVELYIVVDGGSPIFMHFDGMETPEGKVVYDDFGLCFRFFTCHRLLNYPDALQVRQMVFLNVGNRDTIFLTEGDIS